MKTLILFLLLLPSTLLATEGFSLLFENGEKIIQVVPVSEEFLSDQITREDLRIYNSDEEQVKANQALSKMFYDMLDPEYDKPQTAEILWSRYKIGLHPSTVKVMEKVLLNALKTIPLNSF